MDIIFTKHAKEQMKERNIREDDVIDAIKFPKKTRKTERAYYVQRKTVSGKIEVVYTRENYIKVITVYPL